LFHLLLLFHLLHLLLLLLLLLLCLNIDAYPDLSSFNLRPWLTSNVGKNYPNPPFTNELTSGILAEFVGKSVQNTWFLSRTTNIWTYNGHLLPIASSAKQ